MDNKEIEMEYVRALSRIAGNTDRLDRLQQEMALDVARARAAGASWREVGECLGTSAQAAWERYRPRKPPRPMTGQGDLFPTLAPEADE